MCKKGMQSKIWKDLTIVAFDTETTGQYPLQAEICEIAAVKWHQGQIVGSFHTLLCPANTIPDEVIKIHGITNEMVKDAPPMVQVLPQFLQFIRESVVVA